ncbi:uncharacterized protein [Palaemon carinicauda]|uniref:uncharacterized protein n=1 Tax=Palaemon carinicauda TaxID=392227 RepID=UPI0035B5EBEA
MESDLRQRLNEGCKVLGVVKGVVKDRTLGMNIKRVLHKKVIVPTGMYGSELWGMKVTKTQKLNGLEMKCLGNMAGESRLDRVINKVVRVRTGVRNELAARLCMDVLRWFGDVEIMEKGCLLKKMCSLTGGMKDENVDQRL